MTSLFDDNDDATKLRRKYGVSPANGVRARAWADSPTVRWLAAAALAGLVAYFTTIGTINTQVGRLDQREGDHFQQLMQRIDDFHKELTEHLDQDAHRR